MFRSKSKNTKTKKQKVKKKTIWVQINQHFFDKVHCILQKISKFFNDGTLISQNIKFYYKRQV